MSLRCTFATTVRVLGQLRHDPRTVALMLLIPSVLMILLRYVFNSAVFFDSVALPLLGIFPFITMFLITSVAMLRERTSGTLERILATPISKLDLLLGYGIAFALMAALQAGITCAVTFGLLGLDTQGSIASVVLVAVTVALLGTALGLFVSAFAQTEFQAVQFMPAFVLPQLLLCGLFAPREDMASLLEGLSYAMPLTYSVEALTEVGSHANWTSSLSINLLILAGITVACLSLAAATLRRRTA